MNLHLLYIDPGAGSAIFSIIIGLTAAAYFLFQAFYIKLKIFITGGKAKRKPKNKFVIYAEDKRYWALFKPILEEFEKRETQLLYLTSSKDDPVFDMCFQYIKAECLGEGNKAFARLNFLSADIVLATTPGLDVYQWKRSKNVNHYCHIFHTPSESAGYEFFGMDYYDSILVSGSDYQEKHIRKLEEVRNLPEKQVVTVGCPYLDEFEKKINNIPNEEDHVFTVLVSPTWGSSSLLSRFGEKLLDPLLKTNWKIIIRPHPQSLIAEKEMINCLSVKYAENSNLEWDFERENIFSLKKADVMVSDGSGIIFDYVFLRDKPVFCINENFDMRLRDAFEIYENPEDNWNYRTLKNVGFEIKPDALNELPDQILKVSNDIDLKSVIAKTKAEAWHYQGEAGKQTANFMISTVETMYL